MLGVGFTTVATNSDIDETMNIKEVFKKYPENEPNYNGVNYLTLVNVNNHICYSITYFNNDAEFEPDYGKVVAYSQLDPKAVLNALNIVVNQSEQCAHTSSDVRTLICDVCDECGEILDVLD